MSAKKTESEKAESGENGKAGHSRFFFQGTRLPAIVAWHCTHCMALHGVARIARHCTHCMALRAGGVCNDAMNPWLSARTWHSLTGAATDFPGESSRPWRPSTSDTIRWCVCKTRAGNASHFCAVPSHPQPLSRGERGVRGSARHTRKRYYVRSAGRHGGIGPLAVSSK
jgi:hypothetical protein